MEVENQSNCDVIMCDASAMFADNETSIEPLERYEMLK